MKIVQWFLVMSFLFSPISSFALRCETEINQVLAAWEMTGIQPDYKSGNAVYKKAAKPDPNSFFDTLPHGREVEVTGQNQSNAKIIITSRVHHKNPDEATRLKEPILKSLDKDMIVVLNRNTCKLEGFRAFHWEPQGKKLVAAEASVDPNQCKRIYELYQATGKAKQPSDAEIFKQLVVEQKTTPVFEKLYLNRIIPNCRHSSKYSGKFEIDNPVMIRLAFSEEEIKRLGSKNSPNQTLFDRRPAGVSPGY